MRLSKAARIVIMASGTLVLGALAGLSTGDAIETWYAGLAKPDFNPPNWLFGPAWTVLYVLMGTAAGLVWHVGTEYPQVRKALGLYAVQLFLNLIWTPVFFALRQPVIALVVIIVLLILIAITMRAFRRVHTTAMWLLLPYLCWVAFATALNAAIVQLN